MKQIKHKPLSPHEQVGSAGDKPGATVPCGDNYSPPGFYLAPADSFVGA